MANTINPILLPTCQEILKLLADKEDLSVLRQLSAQCNNGLSSTYFDLVEKCAVISLDLEKGIPNSYLSKVSKDVSYIYRAVQILDSGFMDPELNGEAGAQEVKDFLHLVSPQIKNLKMGPLIGQNQHFITLLQELCQSFRNLKTFELYHTMHDLNAATASNILIQLPITTHIKIYQYVFNTADLIEVYENWSKLQNISFHGEILKVDVGSVNIINLEQVQKWFKSSGSDFKKVKIDNFFTHDPTIEAVHNLIQWLDALFGAIKPQYLILLQALDNLNYWNLSLFPNLGGWKENIQELRLRVYAYPLTFLKEFPNLKKLLLFSIDVDLCLLPDPTISDEDNLKTVFEGKEELELNFKTYGYPTIRGQSLSIFFHGPVHRFIPELIAQIHV